MTTALPGRLNEGVLINAPAGYLEFGPNPLPAALTVPGSPIASLEVQIGTGPLTPVTAAIDSGGLAGAIPSSLAGNNVVLSPPGLPFTVNETLAPGTQISVYTSNGATLLYQYTTTAADTPVVVPGDTTTVPFNTGLVPFLQQPVYIANGPNSGSPGFAPFAPNVGTTIFDQ